MSDDAPQTVVVDVHYMADDDSHIGSTRYYVLLTDETSIGSTMSLGATDAR